MEIYGIIIGCVIAVIGYFLNDTMSNLKSVIKQTTENTNKLNLVELDLLNKHSNLNEKFDSLNTSVKELTIEIKALNKEIQKKI